MSMWATKFTWKFILHFIIDNRIVFSSCSHRMPFHSWRWRRNQRQQLGSWQRPLSPAGVVTISHVSSWNFSTTRWAAIPHLQATRVDSICWLYMSVFNLSWILLASWSPIMAQLILKTCFMFVACLYIPNFGASGGLQGCSAIYIGISSIHLYCNDCCRCCGMNTFLGRTHAAV